MKFASSKENPFIPNGQGNRHSHRLPSLFRVHTLNPLNTNVALISPSNETFACFSNTALQNMFSRS